MKPLRLMLIFIRIPINAFQPQNPQNHEILVLAQVNAAVDDAAALGEANLKLMSAVRHNSRSVPVADRKRAQTLLHSVAVRPRGQKRVSFICSPSLSTLSILMI